MRRGMRDETTVFQALEPTWPELFHFFGLLFSSRSSNLILQSDFVHERTFAHIVWDYQTRGSSHSFFSFWIRGILRGPFWWSCEEALLWESNHLTLHLQARGPYKRLMGCQTVPGGFSPKPKRKGPKKRKKWWTFKKFKAKVWERSGKFFKLVGPAVPAVPLLFQFIQFWSV